MQQAPHITLYGPQGQRKYLTAEERRRFLAAAMTCRRPELRTLCLFLAYTGCRISEALAITSAAIALTDGFVSIRCLKKRKGSVVFREVPIPRELANALRTDWISWTRPTGYGAFRVVARGSSLRQS